jgi:hypothetical protein
VIARNLKRRHLDAGQRAALATELLPLLEAEAKERQRAAGGDRRSEAKKSVVEIIPQPILEPDERNPPARDEAASLAEANPRYVSDAKRIKEEAPEVFEKVKAGEINIPAAKRKIAAMNSEPAEMRQPPKAAAGWAVKQFDRIVEKHDNDEIRQLCELLAGFLGLSLGG